MVTKLADRFSTALLLLVSLLMIGWGAVCGARAEIVMRDAAGREVRLQAPASRIVTNESLLLISLSLIDPKPVERIAGWAAPQRFDKGMYAAFRERFPEIDDIPVVGAVAPANVSVETILSARPDLFVVSIWTPGWISVTDKLTAAGIPVIFLEGPESEARGPAEETAFSIDLLGQAIGRDAQAEAFAAFVRAHAKLVAERLANVTERPKVLIDAHAGTLCCYTPGADNRITRYLELAGGRNIGAGPVPGYDGQLSLEYVLGADPDIYIGTGSPHLAQRGGLVVGGRIDADLARASLRDVVGRNLLDRLTAIKEGRAFAVSHQLSISALNVLVLECFAKWIHPDLFSDLDPADTLAEINRRFMAVPVEGTFWIGLRDD